MRGVRVPECIPRGEPRSRRRGAGRSGDGREPGAARAAKGNGPYLCHKRGGRCPGWVLRRNEGRCGGRSSRRRALASGATGQEFRAGARVCPSQGQGGRRAGPVVDGAAHHLGPEVVRDACRRRRRRLLSRRRAARAGGAAGLGRPGRGWMAQNASSNAKRRRSAQGSGASWRASACVEVRVCGGVAG